jgi:hypothetical protein
MRLPDGIWVTTSIWVGAGIPNPECAPDEHQWESQGGPRQPEESGEVPIQMEKCSRCGWIRGRYLENPHPEVE